MQYFQSFGLGIKPLPRPTPNFITLQTKLEKGIKFLELNYGRIIFPCSFVHSEGAKGVSFKMTVLCEKRSYDAILADLGPSFLSRVRPLVSKPLLEHIF